MAYMKISLWNITEQPGPVDGNVYITNHAFRLLIRIRGPKRNVTEEWRRQRWEHVAFKADELRTINWVMHDCYVCCLTTLPTDKII